MTEQRQGHDQNLDMDPDVPGSHQAADPKL